MMTYVVESFTALLALQLTAADLCDQMILLKFDLCYPSNSQSFAQSFLLAIAATESNQSMPFNLCSSIISSRPGISAISM